MIIFCTSADRLINESIWFFLLLGSVMKGGNVFSIGQRMNRMYLCVRCCPLPCFVATSYRERTAADRHIARHFSFSSRKEDSGADLLHCNPGVMLISTFPFLKHKKNMKRAPSQTTIHRTVGISAFDPVLIPPPTLYRNRQSSVPSPKIPAVWCHSISSFCLFSRGKFVNKKEGKGIIVDTHASAQQLHDPFLLRP